MADEYVRSNEVLIFLSFLHIKTFYNHFLLAENMKFEIGANWIHGVLGNPLYEIAIAHGLVDIISTSKPHKVVAATEDGKQVPFSVLQVCKI